MKKTINYKSNGITVEIEVSNTGDIWHNGNKLPKHGFGTAYKYDCCHIWDRENRKNMTISVHRAVCMAFHPVENFENLVVDHIDGDTKHNVASNLRWTTAEWNKQRKSANIKRSQNAKCVSRRDYRVKLTGKLGDVLYFDTAKQAAEHLGCSTQLIYLCGEKRPELHAVRAKGYRVEWIAR